MKRCARGAAHSHRTEQRGGTVFRIADIPPEANSVRADMARHGVNVSAEGRKRTSCFTKPIRRLRHRYRRRDMGDDG